MVTGRLPPLGTMPDCGDSVSQLEPSWVPLLALQFRGRTPGLLTVTTWGAGLVLPSTPVNDSTAGVSCSTASCPGCNCVTCIFTDSLTRSAFDVKMTSALYDPTGRVERSTASITCIC